MKKYNWKNKTILLADNDKFNQTLIKIVLIKTDCNLLIFKNGKDAINYCKKDNKIGIVLTEILLPGADGYEVINRIKEIRKDLPIIVQTACTMNHEKENCFALGCNDYITKPLNLKKLLEVIDNWLIE